MLPFFNYICRKQYGLSHPLRYGFEQSPTGP